MHHPRSKSLRKSVIASAVGLAIGGTSPMCFSALASNASLLLLPAEDGSVCRLGGTPPDNCLYGVTDPVMTGSWFAMEASAPGTQINELTKIQTAGSATITLGTTQSATGSHGGPIDGSESPAFDIWEFFGNTGMDFTQTPIDITGTSGDQVDLDLSGWAVTWNHIPVIDMGGGVQDCGTTSDGICVDSNSNDLGGTADNGTGMGTINCYDLLTDIPPFNELTYPGDKPGGSTVECNEDKFFELRYETVVPLADPSNFGGVAYSLNLVGQIAGSTTTTTTGESTTTTADDTTTTTTTPIVTTTVTPTTTTTTTLPPDTTPPEITINGSNPTNVTQGENYSDDGATATDDRDGTVAASASQTDLLAIDTTDISSYTVTYTATDKAGNQNTAVRTVNVVYANETKKGKFGCSASPATVSGTALGDTTLLAGFLAWLGLAFRRRQRNNNT